MSARFARALAAATMCSFALAASSAADEMLHVGFGETDISPDVGGERPVWIAGYGQNRKAAGVHDPLFARAVVLFDGKTKIALVSVDLVGMQYPDVKRIRAKLPEIDYVMVSSSHNHEGPDVIGLWGPSPVASGVDPEYVTRVVERSAAAVLQADENLAPARASYGTAEDNTLLRDSRQPIVYDGVLRALRFTRSEDDATLGLLVQWNCHPESLGSRNKQISADFPYATVAALRRQYNCPVAYFTGTVGGLLTPPDEGIRDGQGNPLATGTFEYADAYGLAVANLASRAVEAAEPIEMAPLRFAAKPVSMPLENPGYHLARTVGLLPREAHVWTGDLETIGPPVGEKTPTDKVAIVTEVAYLRLGDLHVACIPGEIYPELVYGQYQQPVDPGADFPDAPLERSVKDILPGDKMMLFGLANDEIGYIIPLRQWDHQPPYAYGRQKSQYGEVNSCGPQIAPLVMKSLENRVQELGP